jgi:hypothetical protein
MRRQGPVETKHLYAFRATPFHGGPEQSPFEGGSRGMFFLGLFLRTLS